MSATGLDHNVENKARLAGHVHWVMAKNKSLFLSIARTRSGCFCQRRTPVVARTYTTVEAPYGTCMKQGETLSIVKLTIKKTNVLTEPQASDKILTSHLL